MNRLGLVRRLLALSALAAVSSAGSAQPPGVVGLPLDCRDLPLRGPNPRVLGLPAALDAVERRELTFDELQYTLAWAEREPDPAFAPVLKRIVEANRCSPEIAVGLAFVALEVIGEPSSYFLAYAQDWRRDDLVAEQAFDVLAVRNDTTVYDALAAVVAEAPERARRGGDFASAFRNYRGGLIAWEQFERWPVDRQLDYAAYSVLDVLGGYLHDGPEGDTLFVGEGQLSSRLWASTRRALRLLARAYPTAVEGALDAYEDTLKARTPAYGETPAQQALYLAVGRPRAAEAAFPPGYSLPSAAPPGTTLALSVCIEDRGGDRGFGPDALAAVFSYGAPPGLLPADPVRVPYGPANALAGPWDPAAPLRPVPPEVFFLPSEPDAPGRPFRVAFRPGDRVSWTLLGQTVTASSATPLCGAPPPR